MTLPIAKLEPRTCPVCKALFQPHRRDQQTCSTACHRRRQHNVYRWLVTWVQDGKFGGYLFSVSINGGPPIKRFLMPTLTGYVVFPKELVISKNKMERMQKPLRKQVVQIVTSGDPRYHGKQQRIEKSEPTQEQPQIEQPKPEPVYFFYASPCCHWWCTTLDGMQVCPCGKKYELLVSDGTVNPALTKVEYKAEDFRKLGKDFHKQ